MRPFSEPLELATGSFRPGGSVTTSTSTGSPRRAKSPEDGAIFAGNWAIVAEDPEREAAKVGDHVLYQINEYVKWGAFGPPGEVPLFPDAPTAIENGLYELWTADQAVESLTAMLTQYPQIKDVHFWAQFPGEPLESGSARLQYLATHVLPRREGGRCLILPESFNPPNRRSGLGTGTAPLPTIKRNRGD